MQPWKLGDEVWSAFIRDLRYFPKLVGRVSGIGRFGITVRLLKPNGKGEAFERIHFEARAWSTEAEALAWCAAEVGPYGPGEGRDGGGHVPVPKLPLGPMGPLPGSQR